MEQINLGYSLKNIPVPDQKTYLNMLVSALEQGLHRMQWAASFELNQIKSAKKKETFGFPTSNTAPNLPELQDFKAGLIKIAESVEFKKQSNPLQQKMKVDNRNIKTTSKVLLGADKTTNFYKFEADDHKKLLQNNITKEYKKAPQNIIEKINKQDKNIAEKLDISDRMFQMVKREAQITVKDHKENFRNNTKCRLINPTKSELGIVSKSVLRQKINIIKEKSKLNQWKDSNCVRRWFENLPQKQAHSFIQWDFESFYPSITKDLLNKAITHAKKYVEFSEHDIEVIFQARKSVLIHEDTAWIKKEGDLFDVTMGSYDGAEVCELVGLYILSLLVHIRGRAGQYRDDGIMALKGSARQVENTKKEICRILQSTGLGITIDANLKIVNILDLTLNLTTGTYQTFNKPNNIPLYVHKESNHPPSILKNIPLSVNKRLNLNSSNKEMFDQTSAPFQKSLKDSGYSHTLNFEKINEEPQNRNSKNRKRKIFWFVPPYSTSVTTRIGAKILALVDSSFPPLHRLNKIFNRNTVKVSYRTTPNMKQIIAGHNKKIFNQSQPNQTKPCRCTAEPCPVGGLCKQEAVIYQAVVTHQDITSKEILKESYVGMTGTTFMKRYANHKSSFNLKEKYADTELSKYIWSLKEQNLQYKIKWKIIDRSQTFSPISRICNLCTLERDYLIFRKDLHTLNKNSEFGHHCPHKRFKKLSVTK